MRAETLTIRWWTEESPHSRKGTVVRGTLAGLDGKVEASFEGFPQLESALRRRMKALKASAREPGA